MSKPWIFISPSSRGIGHALTRHLLQTTTLPIIATARSDPERVKESILSSSSSLSDQESRLHVLNVDVTSEETLEAASEETSRLFPPKTHHLHLGFALPGVLFPEKSPRQVNYDDALNTYKVNTLGPLMLMKWFGDKFLPAKSLDLSSSSSPPEQEQQEIKIPNHATWLTNSARVGSTTDNQLAGWYSYRSSKAGVTSITKSFDLYLRQSRSGDNAIALAYHPGTVKTELSREFWHSVAEREGEDRLFSPEFAAERLVEVALGRTLADRGRFWDWKGEEVPP